MEKVTIITVILIIITTIMMPIIIITMVIKTHSIYKVKKNIIGLNVKTDVVSQYKNRCEIYFTFVKIRPIHAHLNHLAKKY